jgi:hypothetical protein
MQRVQASAAPRATAPADAQARAALGHTPHEHETFSAVFDAAVSFRSKGPCDDGAAAGGSGSAGALAVAQTPEAARRGGLLSAGAGGGNPSSALSLAASTPSTVHPSPAPRSALRPVVAQAATDPAAEPARGGAPSQRERTQTTPPSLVPPRCGGTPSTPCFGSGAEESNVAERCQSAAAQAAAGPAAAGSDAADRTPAPAMLATLPSTTIVADTPGTELPVELEHAGAGAACSEVAVQRMPQQQSQRDEDHAAAEMGALDVQRGADRLSTAATAEGSRQVQPSAAEQGTPDAVQCDSPGQQGTTPRGAAAVAPSEAAKHTPCSPTTSDEMDFMNSFSASAWAPPPCQQAEAVIQPRHSSAPAAVAAGSACGLPAGGWCTAAPRLGFASSANVPARMQPPPANCAQLHQQMHCQQHAAHGRLHGSSAGPAVRHASQPCVPAARALPQPPVAQPRLSCPAATGHLRSAQPLHHGLAYQQQSQAQGMQAAAGHLQHSNNVQQWSTAHQQALPHAPQGAAQGHFAHDAMPRSHPSAGHAAAAGCQHGAAHAANAVDEVVPVARLAPGEAEQVARLLKWGRVPPERSLASQRDEHRHIVLEVRCHSRHPSSVSGRYANSLCVCPADDGKPGPCKCSAASDMRS